MLPYIHFTPDERICLQKLLSEGKSFRQIAVLMGRSPSTMRDSPFSALIIYAEKSHLILPYFLLTEC